MKNWMTISTIGLLLTVAGCPEVEFEGDDTGLKSCRELTVEQCGQRADCAPINARPLSRENSCLLPSEPVGCMSGDMVCTTSIELSAGPDGECYWFSSGCMPQGWNPDAALCPDEAIDWEPCEQSSKACEDLSLANCEQRQDCRVIDGRKVYEAQQCLMSSEPLGCMPVDVDCGDALTPAKDPSGQCYWFPSTCVPDGWESFFGTSECEVGDYRLCACEEYSAANCDESNGCTKIYGRRGIIEDQCLLDSEAVGCMSASAGCGAAITFALDPTGDCYQLPSGCIPKGWSAPDATSECNYESFPDDKSCDTSSLACEDLTAAQCNDREGCGMISGRRVDTDKQCLLDYEIVGCGFLGAGCDGAITLALGPGGECYWFSSGCIPTGWSPEYNNPECNAPGDIAACN